MTTQPRYRKKLIEVDLPLNAINAESKREKSIRHGHPSTLHLWWSRKPLASCRAVIFASMVDDPSSCCEEFKTAEAQRAERQRLHELIKQLVVWETTDDRKPEAKKIFDQARYEIACSVARSRGENPPDQSNPTEVLNYLNDRALPIHDPFAGGGSIPLEAQRLGLRAVASDLNPIAVLINKALIELPLKFRNRPPVNPEADAMGMTVGKGRNRRRIVWRGAAGLANDIRYYGRHMRELAWERIGHLYPKAQLPDGGEATVIAWLWTRTVPCPNPACGVAMPLKTTFQASKKRGNEHWMNPVVDRAAKTVSFEVQNHDEGVPKGGTVDGKGAICLACNTASPLSYVREQSRAGNMGEQMTAIVAEGDRKRLFLSPTDEHVRVAGFARADWRPTQTLPEEALGFSVQGYGFKQWSELYTERSLKGLTTFSDCLVEVRERLSRDGADSSYADVICTYLALAIGRLSNSCSSFARWQNSGDFIAGVFAMQTLSMIWDFAESNPFCTATQNWMAQIEWIARVVDKLPSNVNTGEVHQADAATTIHSYDGPVIVTDPPYYDNIGYADLSDFFYVWLRPLLRDIYPDLFAGILVPKSEEMIASPSRFEDSRQRFERLLGQTLQLIRERCSREFPSSIFYAYKQQEEEKDGRTSTGWETMLTALVQAGFEIVGTWPMRTERPGRSRQIGSNALASSVILVCRPREEEAQVATRRQFLDELEAELPVALDQLTREGHIAPVDLRQAAIGPGMEIYSQYRRVETIGGEPVSVRVALAEINRVVDEYAEHQEGDLDPETRFCLTWLKQYGFRQGEYGVAQDLARSHNVVVETLRDFNRILNASAGLMRLLPLDGFGPERQFRLGAMTAWEGAFRMAYHFGTKADKGDVTGAATVARMMGSNVESVERLARILYDHFDRKGDSGHSVLFNTLVSEWPNILAQMQGPEQTALGFEA